MHLLTPKEVDAVRREQEASAVKGAKKIIDMANKAIKKANTIKDSTEKQIIEANEMTSATISKYIVDVNNLSAEIELLEIKRSELLKPITAELEQLEKERLQLVEEKRVFNKDVQDLVLTRDEIVERQKVISKREQELKKKEEDLLKRESDIQKNEAASNELVKKTNEECSRILEEQNKILLETEKTKKKYASLVSEVRTKSWLLDEKQKDLSKREQKYQSDMATLQVAFKLARENGIM
jgi:hypothetical protein